MPKPVFGRGELRRVVGACRWVKATAAFLPLLKPFLIRRLADEPGLARKVWHLTADQLFRLWERLKDHQAHSGRRPRPRPTRGARGS
jgi:hypothetical protein